MSNLLKDLKLKSDISATSRGHELGKWTHLLDHLCYASCVDCSAIVVCDSKSDKIMGAASVQTCPEFAESWGKVEGSRK